MPDRQHYAPTRDLGASSEAQPGTPTRHSQFHASTPKEITMIDNYQRAARNHPGPDKIRPSAACIGRAMENEAQPASDHQTFTQSTLTQLARLDSALTTAGLDLSSLEGRFMGMGQTGAGESVAAEPIVRSAASEIQAHLEYLIDLATDLSISAHRLNSSI